MPHERHTHGTDNYQRRKYLLRILAAGVVALFISVPACTVPDMDMDDDDQKATYRWSLAAEAPGSAFMAVHGTSADNVFAVGADAGTGPVVIHWDGSAWSKLETGLRGDLWWVYAIDDVAFMCGSDANILRYDGTFERLPSPGLGEHIVYGIWGSSANDVYAVGSASARNGFIWHFDGTEWTSIDIPDDVPLDENRDHPQFLKVWGTSADEIWVVGERGVLLRGNASDGFEVIETPSESFLFTVHGIEGRVVAVGSDNDGIVLDTGSPVSQSVVSGSQLLQGAWVTAAGDVWVSGVQGAVFREGDEGFERMETGIEKSIQSLHAVWVDENDGVWSVGGNVLDASLDDGSLVYGHPTLDAPELIHVEDPAATVDNSCPADLVDPHPDSSIARRWNEQLLNAVRRDIPRPTVHARNMFHLSGAMWDIWAAFDETAVGYLVQESQASDDPDAALEEAISYASYRILMHRYATAVGGEVSTSCFDSFMDTLGYDPAETSTEGDTPSAFGNRVGQAYIDSYADDGANEQNNYADPAGYVPETPRLTVANVGSNTDDPTMWQQIVLAQAETQNGIPEGSGVRGYIGAHWGDVTPFALERSAPGEPYYIVDGPTTLDDDLVDATLEVVRKSSELDTEEGVMVDISPASYGNNPLGTNDGTGYDVNPATGEPYEEQLVNRGDFTRLLSEFWADGPASETPPGHWNTLANDLAEYPGFERRLYGMGEPLDPLSWDVHVYLALNGAVHDAAIAAWELKRTHLTARPITLIRTLGARGQRTDPDGPSYDPDGLPLEDGLVEVITEESSAPGERHAQLRRYIGEIAVFSWRGEPGDRSNEIGGVDWIRATEWIPYQRRTFVTPAFPGFVSGHSTFSRSAAEVLTQLTGSEYFPGGIGGYVLDPGWLTFEAGPTTTVELQWARYYDAADQAGQSRLWGGIHVRQDDFVGRTVGDDVGRLAIMKAQAYFDGTAAESSEE